MGKKDLNMMLSCSLLIVMTTAVLLPLCGLKINDHNRRNPPIVTNMATLSSFSSPEELFRRFHTYRIARHDQIAPDIIMVRNQRLGQVQPRDVRWCGHLPQP
ncbi:Uncharacterised protein [Citrobacter amalonaticus]|nr:Uncharacterised protein [Citrobacter amalonaticus]